MPLIYARRLSHGLFGFCSPIPRVFLDFLVLCFFCASVFSGFSTSKIGSGASTNSGLSRNRFRTWIPSFANTAILTIAAQLDHSNGGYAKALSQNGLVLSGFLINPVGCFMSNRNGCCLWILSPNGW